MSYKEKTRESLTLGVYNCGAQRCSPGLSWGEGVRDHYLIHFVLSGKGYLKSAGVTHALTPGDLFMIYPGTAIKYWADMDEPWVYDWVGFNGGEASFLLQRTAFTRAHPVLHYDDTRIPNALSAIIEARGSALCHQTRMIGLLYTFLSLLLELSDTASHAGSGFDYIGSATRFVSRNYASPIDVSDIAQGVGVSRSHLYRVFVRELGVTPNEYLTQFRISQACELLTQGNLPVCAVSSSVGYEDPLYFSRVFKRVKGVSPRSFASRRGVTGIKTENL